MRDKIHIAVRTALEKEGWKTINDPYKFQLEDVTVKVDLETEKLVEILKEEESLLVEIKSFINESIIYDFYQAYGQFDFYRFWVHRKLPNKDIYLAVSLPAYKRMQEVGAIRDFMEAKKINLIVVDVPRKKVVKWITY